MEEPVEVKKISFLRRQLSGERTRAQLVFDLIFGAIAPILCLLFDPVVFRGDPCTFGGGFLAPYKVFAYVAIGIGILTLIIWLAADMAIFGRVLPLIAGILLTGMVFAFGLGLIMLPFTLFGLLIVIGALGFVPFVTAFVYYRNGIRALQRAREHFAGAGRIGLVALVLAGFLLVVGIPALAQSQSDRIAPPVQVNCPSV